MKWKVTFPMGKKNIFLMHYYMFKNIFEKFINEYIFK